MTPKHKTPNSPPPPCSPCPRWLNLLRNSPAFSLVELLVVMAIIGIMIGLSALAVQGMRAPALQHAADQVMSGLSLARQIAITKNTQAAFLIATNTNSGFPAEPYRYWSVVYSNRGNSTWTLAKDWEALPNGAFFLDTRGQGGADYLTIGGNPLADDYSVGTFQPNKFATATFTVNGTAINNATIPFIQFNSDGTKSSGDDDFYEAEGFTGSGVHGFR